MLFRSQSYAFGSGTALTTLEVAQAWRHLINLLDTSNQLLIDNGNATPTDADLYLQMRSQLFPRYTRTTSLLTLRQQGGATNQLAEATP